ncbi:MAG TPA: hypothetical protein VL588_05195 [Bdellovibrionota bacterium]|jgi:hypothetical protein|nr:hypothetical protein [Bdellovibrionota bacterium]
MQGQMVERWTQKDVTRWIAGACAGLFAGAAMLVFSMVLSAAFGGDAWGPAKISAVPFLGGKAMAYGNSTGILVGVIVHEVLAMVLGIIYAHFAFTNSLPALLGVGFTWGAFSWVFLNNLYTNSFREVLVQSLPAGQAFFSCMVFGITLSSVAFFDRMLRR